MYREIPNFAGRKKILVHLIIEIYHNIEYK